MKHGIALLATAMAAAGLAAQGLSGSVETRLGWYWGSHELLPETQVLGLGLAGKVGDAESPAAQYLAKARLSYDPSTGLAKPSLDEAWIKLFEGPFDLSFGNQLVAWSVSDAFTPSDVVNPLDLSLPVDPAKIAVPLARVVYNSDVLTADFVAQPLWEPSVLPGSRWLPANPLAVLPVTNTTPAFTWDNVAYGGHLKASFDLLGGLDLGATFYRGLLPTPRPVVAFTGPYPTGINLVYDRATRLGADLVFAPGGDLLLKSEWVYTTLDDSNLLDPQPAQAAAEGVSGIEYTLGPARLVGEYVLDWAKSSTGADDLKHSVVGILSLSPDSRLDLKVAGIYDFTGAGSGMVSPRLEYTLADGVKLQAESYFFFGDADASFTSLGVAQPSYGAWKDNNLGRVGLVYSF